MRANVKHAMLKFSTIFWNILKIQKKITEKYYFLKKLYKLSLSTDILVFCKFILRSNEKETSRKIYLGFRKLICEVLIMIQFLGSVKKILTIFDH